MATCEGYNYGFKKCNQLATKTLPASRGFPSAMVCETHYKSCKKAAAKLNKSINKKNTK
jgi:hypothetical protein